MTWLLDGSVLVALAINTHVFHRRTLQWFDALSEPFATCAITEGTLLRVHMQMASDKSVAAAWSALLAIHAMPDHQFWSDGFSYREVSKSGLHGHGQIADAWLAELARRKGAKLATLDTALSALHTDVGFLIEKPRFFTNPQESSHVCKTLLSHKLHRFPFHRESSRKRRNSATGLHIG